MSSFRAYSPCRMRKEKDGSKMHTKDDLRGTYVEARRFMNWFRTSADIVTPALYVAHAASAVLAFKTISRDVSRLSRRKAEFTRDVYEIAPREKKKRIATNDHDDDEDDDEGSHHPGHRSPRKNSIVSFRFYDAVTPKISSSRIQTGKRHGGRRRKDDGEDQSSRKLFRAEIHTAMQISGVEHSRGVGYASGRMPVSSLTRATSSS